MKTSEDLAIDAAVKVVTAEFEMRKSWGSDGISVTFEGVRKETLENAWKYLGKVFAEMLE